jgi:hypothetical protein
MGSKESKPAAVAPPSPAPGPSAAEAPESTHIDDLIKSGRYKVARPETLEMIRQIQPTPHKEPLENGAEVKDLRQYIVEQEGLDIGKARKRALSQQWRFFLSSEPIQRGLDAGLILGCVSAAFSARNPAKRQPPRVAIFWLAGFAVGVIAVPSMVFFADSINSRQIKKKEKELFTRQREDFYNKRKE